METDIDAMTDRELLGELADRVMEWERTLEGIDAWSHVGDDDMESTLVMDEDEAFCRVREVIRKVKDDNSICQC